MQTKANANITFEIQFKSVLCEVRRGKKNAVLKFLERFLC